MVDNIMECKAENFLHFLFIGYNEFGNEVLPRET